MRNKIVVLQKAIRSYLKARNVAFEQRERRYHAVTKRTYEQGRRHAYLRPRIAQRLHSLEILRGAIVELYYEQRHAAVRKMRPMSRDSDDVQISIQASRCLQFLNPKNIIMAITDDDLTSRAAQIEERQVRERTLRATKSELDRSRSFSRYSSMRKIVPSTGTSSELVKDSSPSHGSPSTNGHNPNRENEPRQGQEAIDTPESKQISLFDDSDAEVQNGGHRTSEKQNAANGTPFPSKTPKRTHSSKVLTSSYKLASSIAVDPKTGAPHCGESSQPADGTIASSLWNTQKAYHNAKLLWNDRGGSCSANLPNAQNQSVCNETTSSALDFLHYQHIESTPDDLDDAYRNFRDRVKHAHKTASMLEKEDSFVLDGMDENEDTTSTLSSSSFLLQSTSSFGRRRIYNEQRRASMGTRPPKSISTCVRSGSGEMFPTVAIPSPSNGSSSNSLIFSTPLKLFSTPRSTPQVTPHAQNRTPSSSMVTSSVSKVNTGERMPLPPKPGKKGERGKEFSSDGLVLEISDMAERVTPLASSTDGALASAPHRAPPSGSPRCITQTQLEHLNSPNPDPLYPLSFQTPRRFLARDYLSGSMPEESTCSSISSCPITGLSDTPRVDMDAPDVMSSLLLSISPRPGITPSSGRSKEHHYSSTPCDDGMVMGQHRTAPSKRMPLSTGMTNVAELVRNRLQLSSPLVVPSQMMYAVSAASSKEEIRVNKTTDHSILEMRNDALVSSHPVNTGLPPLMAKSPQVQMSRITGTGNFKKNPQHEHTFTSLVTSLSPTPDRSSSTAKKSNGEDGIASVSPLSALEDLSKRMDAGGLQGFSALPHSSSECLEGWPQTVPPDATHHDTTNTLEQPRFAYARNTRTAGAQTTCSGGIQLDPFLNHDEDEVVTPTPICECVQCTTGVSGGAVFHAQRTVIRSSHEFKERNSTSAVESSVVNGALRSTLERGEPVTDLDLRVPHPPTARSNNNTFENGTTEYTQKREANARRKKSTKQKKSISKTSVVLTQLHNDESSLRQSASHSTLFLQSQRSRRFHSSQQLLGRGTIPSATKTPVSNVADLSNTLITGVPLVPQPLRRGIACGTSSNTKSALLVPASALTGGDATQEKGSGNGATRSRVVAQQQGVEEVASGVHRIPMNRPLNSMKQKQRCEKGGPLLVASAQRQNQQPTPVASHRQSVNHKSSGNAWKPSMGWAPSSSTSSSFSARANYLQTRSSQTTTPLHAPRPVGGAAILNRHRFPSQANLVAPERRVMVSFGGNSVAAGFGNVME